MSDWSNGYEHNSSHYTNPSTWSNDSNSQFPSQSANYYNSSSEYINFDEFLSQMQGGANPQINSTHYNNVPYQNYSLNQYSQMPTSSQNLNQNTFMYGPGTSADRYGSLLSTRTSEDQYRGLNNPNSTYVSNRYPNSTLTPTATEFVPKMSQHSPLGSDSRAYVCSESNEVHTENDDYRINTGRNSQTNHGESSDKQSWKPNSRTNGKDGFVFYNSSLNKVNQDMKNGGKAAANYSNKQKSWAGTQRLRAMDRNNVDDERFANNYVQYKEEHQEVSTNKSRETSSPKASHNKIQISSEYSDNKEMTQRERLSEQLDKGTLECLVCCERVKQMETVWSCSNCYHVLHLRCIRKWAISSMQEGKWRCPACQNISRDVPTEYRCLCGAVRSPEWQRGVAGAHTCGRPCARQRSCPHPCTLLCHPGPCPPCHATVSKKCGCGAETRSVLCSSKLAQVCGRICGRKLNCGEHTCSQSCHEGPCEECKETLKQECFCPAAKSREVVCDADTSGQRNWACGDVCGRVLACGAHVCRDQCHPPPCQPCKMLPETVDTCPCGKMKLEKDRRKLCTDPIPLCGNICAKPLPCGPPGDRHFCKQECHEGNCPVCPDKTLLPCRCGHSSKEVLCSELPQMLNNIFCQKKCNKKLSCGRHRCRELCCAVDVHRCRQVCGRTLSCQLHRCEEFCHTGHCPICPRVSFTELRCECGAEVVLPPVRCGARPPACSAPCGRARACGHPPHHSCHSDECPPCVVLTTKRCHGDHEERKTIPCSQEEFSCGLPCGKPLPCGKHSCIKICHKGPCDTEKCTQPCMEKRSSCGHPCGAPCHAGDEEAQCPSTSPCRRPVRATCLCGRRAQERSCADNARECSKLLSNLVMSKMQEGGSLEMDVSKPGLHLKTLECDDECRVEARTRQMALALQIRNPDVSSKLAPRYSEHVRQWAMRDPAFAQHVHDKLTELVQLAKKSKQKTRSHSFPSMNWQKRQFIHELCEHFGCESVAYDAEPNRNVVATADKEKSWLPAMSVMEVLAREAGRRRVPGPVTRAPAAHTGSSSFSSFASTSNSRDTNSRSSGGGWATLTPSSTWAARAAARRAPAPAPTPRHEPPSIDYFDNPPDC